MEKIDFKVGSRHFSIEPMKKADIRKCAEIYGKEFNRAYNEKWTVKKAEKKTRELFKKCKFCFTIRERKKIIGLLFASEYLWDDGMHCYVEALIIVKALQGKGIGTAALSMFEGFLKKKGFVGVSFHSLKDPRAMKIWKKQGYKESDWVYLEKELK